MWFRVSGSHHAGHATKSCGHAHNAGWVAFVCGRREAGAGLVRFWAQWRPLVRPRGVGWAGVGDIIRVGFGIIWSLLTKVD